MTMNSFAATNDSLTFLPKDLININTMAPATLITETSGGKKSSTVALLPSGRVGTAYSGLSTKNVYNSQFRIDNMNKKVKACVSVKAETGTGTFNMLFSGPNWSNSGPPTDAGSLFNAQISSAEYKVMCTVPGTMIFLPGSQNLNVAIYNSGNVPLHVGLVYMQAL